MGILKVVPGYLPIHTLSPTITNAFVNISRARHLIDNDFHKGTSLGVYMTNHFCTNIYHTLLHALYMMMGEDHILDVICQLVGRKFL